ncbi:MULTISPECIES: patatin-like phospholipase family protein [Pelosinus]|uniref:Patatin n=1 Tax=Pelosinus fermentans B4 TaxID=1149862 RepID=I8REC5_9FIRM|nr:MULTISPECIES: patatin-like phospholipase family protein [Pelosinus]EIW17738.1 Patatin [Pelosinus fermentans B4]EIW23700.1 Patatin [Pelosinus fermentans A11]OAM94624.1 Patatin [Pelosinus fermentans DSM 17108]SDR13869.1 NTE family protein [Pelosinus fermentans]
MDYPFRNFIFEGGGVKGIAYIGALSVLQEREILPKIERVGGASAGAIMGLLIGLNFSFKEIEDILLSLDFTRFLDDSLGVAFDTTRLFKEFGWYKGDYFRNWIGNLIQIKTGNPDATFKEIFEAGKELEFREMFFIGTNLSTKRSQVFSVEHTPDLCVADAVRISMSIPLLFAAKRGEYNDIYVDGGVLDNYPIKLFDREKYVYEHSNEPEYYKQFNEQLKEYDEAAGLYVFNKETLGFRLDSGREIAMFRELVDPARKEIKDLIEFTKSLVDIYMESQQNQHLHSDDWHRTIYINTLHVKTTEFHLSDEKKKALIQSGRECAERYFEWYDDPANTVHNRPI